MALGAPELLILLAALVLLVLPIVIVVVIVRGVPKKAPSANLPSTMDGPSTP